MDDVIGIVVLLGLVVLAVPVLLVILLVSVSRLRARVGALEATVSSLHHAAAAAARSASASAASASFDARASRVPPPGPAAVAPDVVPQTPAPVIAPVAAPPPLPDMPAARDEASAPLPAPPASPVRTGPPIEAEPMLLSRGLASVRRWFTEGNVPVKIGMLVLFAGVAALVKYASDQGWLRVPIELRLAGMSAAALAGLVVGWRKRGSHRAFALSLQGGMIGILLLIAFGAFRQYGLIPAGLALAVSVVLVAGAGMLAVLQNARALAILALTAGFLAPIWLSTGEGNHVALFSYYAVLNAAILAMAWWRPWRELNLLGFAFTFGIGTFWGALQYQPAHYATTQPFLALFFAFYLLIPLLYVRKAAPQRGRLLDGALVFGTPLVAFSLQAGLMQGRAMALAMCALGVAVIYVVLALIAQRRLRHPLLTEAYAVLAVGFATLAVPLALSARATSGVFALEGAALVWLGLRQQRRLPQLGGLLLQLGAAIALALADPHAAGRALLNPAFMALLLITLGGFASAASYRRAGQDVYAGGWYLWALAWWCANGVSEVEAFVPWASRADALLTLAALTAWIAAEVQARFPARLLVLTTTAGLALAAPLALAQVDVHVQPFAGAGLWAWAVYALLGTRSLVCLRRSGDVVGGLAQGAWWLVWPLAISLLGHFVARQFTLADGWAMAWIGAPWCLLLGVAVLRWRWLTFPLGAVFDRARPVLLAIVLSVVGVWWCVALCSSGGSAPLPWCPLLNPMELLQLIVLLLVARLAWSDQAVGWLQRPRVVLMATAGFVLVTSLTLRSVHHWGELPWTPSLLASSLAQTSLTVVWSILGVVGWVSGSRRAQRTLWLSGAVLMAVVLAKLVMVDRQHLGNLWGIGSFIAYGLLCTVVGYLAPAPPRASTEDTPP
ncbi:MAG: DUF2339 domain-containing protein [Pseudoxanthomonas sp.]